jgi:hypothetical protein
MVDLLLCGKIMFAFPKILVCAHQITKGGPFNGVSRKTKPALQNSVLVCIQPFQVWKIQNYVDIYHYILLILLLVLLPAQLTLFFIALSWSGKGKCACCQEEESFLFHLEAKQIDQSVFNTLAFKSASREAVLALQNYCPVIDLASYGPRIQNYLHSLRRKEKSYIQEMCKICVTNRTSSTKEKRRRYQAAYALRVGTKMLFHAKSNFLPHAQTRSYDLAVF